MFASQLKNKLARGLGLCTFICAFLFGSQPAAFAGTQVPFVASYNLNIQADFSSPPFVSIIAEGSGLASHLGKMTARSVSETVDLSTLEGVAVYEFTAANGDTLLFSIVLVAEPTAPGQFSLHGLWEITGGTGRFDGATGAGSYEGVVQFTSGTTALGEFDLAGDISTVGSNK
jgi:hypothetical protein